MHWGRFASVMIVHAMFVVILFPPWPTVSIAHQDVVRLASRASVNDARQTRNKLLHNCDRLAEYEYSRM
jgi:hypothetical protein